jgi:clan AA aspartic protease
MTGWVDGAGRALIRIRVRHPDFAVETPLDAWIDTGFSGELVLSQDLIASLGLPFGPEVGGVLADGSVVVLQTYTCVIEWFGTWRSVEVVANQGEFPLLGVGLLLGHQLEVDYRSGTLSLV